MELLLFVGMVVKYTVWAGYGVAGTYFGKTAVQYVKDYKEAVAKERM
jgi:hypothetical protein